MSALLRSVGLRRGGQFAPPAPPPGPQAYRYYRVLVTANHGRSTMGVAEVNLYGPAANPNRLSSDPTASSEFSSVYSIAKAFDENPASLWITQDPAVYPEWAAVELPTPILITSYGMQADAVGEGVNRTPKSFVLQGSDDGATWTNLHTTENAPPWAPAEMRSASLVGGYGAIRLNVTANNGRATLNIAELQIRDVIGGPSLATFGTPTASSQFDGVQSASKAFDGDPSTYWSTPSGPGQGWLSYSFARAPTAIAQYAITARADASDGAPRDWTLEGSNDYGQNWTTLHTISNETGWTPGETRTYTI